MWKSVGLAAMAMLSSAATARADEQSISFAPDGRNISIAFGGRVLTFGAEGRPPSSFHIPARALGRDGLSRLAWAPDGKRMALEVDAAVLLVDVATSKATVLLKADGDRVAEFRWSPDGKSLAVAKGGKVIVIDTVAMHGSLWGGPPETSGIAYAPDGKHLAAVGVNSRMGETAKLFIFNTTSGPTTKAEGFATRVVWSLDGAQLAGWGGGYLGVRFFDAAGNARPSSDEKLNASSTHSIVGGGAGFVVEAEQSLLSVSSASLGVTSTAPLQGHAVGFGASADGKTVAALVCTAGGGECDADGSDDNLVLRVYRTTPQLALVRTIKTTVPEAAPAEDRPAVALGDTPPAGNTATPIGAGGPAGGAASDVPTQAPADKRELASDVAVMAGGASDYAYRTKRVEEEELVNRCDSVVAKAFNGGLAPTTMIVASYTGDTPHTRKTPDGADFLTLADVKTIICAKLRETYLATKVGGAAYTAVQSLYFAKKESDIGIVFNKYNKDWTDCSKAVADAKADGLGADVDVALNVATFEGIDLPPSVKFSEVDAKVCRGAQALGGSITKKLQAAEDAKYAPYLKVLGGDKKKMFHDNKMLDGTNWYGSGGKRLDSPADFKGAHAWYYFVRDHNVWPDRWKVEGHKFNGDKFTGDYVHGGIGSEPPGSAYP